MPQHYNPDNCLYCHTRIKRPGLSTCSEACAQKRNAASCRSHAKKRKTDRQYVKQALLTDAEREAHRIAQVRKHNWSKRQLYLTVALCPTCHARIDAQHDCQCSGSATTQAQYRDVVKVLDLKTWKKRIDIK